MARRFSAPYQSEPVSALASWARNLAVFSVVAVLVSILIVRFDFLEMKPALAAGTYDVRLFWHATAIAEAAGQSAEAAACLAEAVPLKPTLFPSERKQLESLELRLALSTNDAASANVKAKL